MKGGVALSNVVVWSKMCLRKVMAYLQPSTPNSNLDLFRFFSSPIQPFVRSCENYKRL